MKVKRLEGNKKKFSDIKLADVFESGGCYYMKTSLLSGLNSYCYNCVNIKDGYHSKFAHDDLVTPLKNCTLVEGYKDED